MLRRVALIRTDVSEKHIFSIIRLTRIGELGTTLAVTSNWSKLRRTTGYFLARWLLPPWWRGYVPPKRRFLHEPQGVTSQKTSFYSHSRENLKSYIALTGWSLQQRYNVFPVRCQLGSYIPEANILHSHCRENFKSYIALSGWTL
jgi:hypothetical protein